MLKITNITFKQHFVTLDVVQECEITVLQKKQLVCEIIARYPNISSHHCVNSRGPRFSDCIKTTNLAHILEHLIIEKSLLKKRQRNIKKTIGCTRRVGDGEFVIKLSYDDDVMMLKTINESIVELNEILCLARDEKEELR